MNTIGILAAICSVPASVICLKLSSQVWVADSSWWPPAVLLQVNSAALIYFVAGNVVGFLNPIGTTIALRNNPPNLVYATIGAPATILLHASLALYFQQSLTLTQWSGIGIIVFGAFLLQKRPASADEPAAKVIPQDVKNDEKNGP